MKKNSTKVLAENLEANNKAYAQMQEHLKNNQNKVAKAILEPYMQTLQKARDKSEELPSQKRGEVKISFVDKVKGPEWRDITYRKLQQLYKDTARKHEKVEDKQNIKPAAVKQAFEKEAYNTFVRGFDFTSVGEKAIKKEIGQFFDNMDKNKPQ